MACREGCVPAPRLLTEAEPVGTRRRWRATRRARGRPRPTWWRRSWSGWPASSREGGRSSASTRRPPGPAGAGPLRAVRPQGAGGPGARVPAQVGRAGERRPRRGADRDVPPGGRPAGHQRTGGVRPGRRRPPRHPDPRAGGPPEDGGGAARARGRQRRRAGAGPPRRLRGGRAWRWSGRGGATGPGARPGRRAAARATHPRRRPSQTSWWRRPAGSAPGSRSSGPEPCPPRSRASAPSCATACNPVGERDVPMSGPGRRARVLPWPSGPDGG